MRKLRAIIILMATSLLLGFYTAFVAAQYFNWFLARAINAHPISYLEMLGIIWGIGLLRNWPRKGKGEREINYDESPNAFWEATIITVLESVGTNTLLLAAGFGLHFLL
jgi:hypothetical protein